MPPRKVDTPPLQPQTCPVFAKTPPLLPAVTIVSGDEGKEEEVVGVSCGAYHTLVLTASGSVYGFGWNKGGRVGASDEIIVDTPVRLETLDGKGVVAMDAGQNFSLALTGKERAIHTHTHATAFFFFGARDGTSSS